MEKTERDKIIKKEAAIKTAKSLMRRANSTRLSKRERTKAALQMVDVILENNLTIIKPARHRGRVT